MLKKAIEKNAVFVVSRCAGFGHEIGGINV
jgi:hypothetical protein